MDKIIKKNRGYFYQGKIYRSKEEIYFSWYLDDIKKYIISSKYEPYSMEVIPKKTAIFYNEEKGKHFDFSFLRSLNYTPDFVIQWKKDLIIHGKSLNYIWYNYNKDRFNNKKNIFCDSVEKISYIEIKGKHTKNNSAIFPVKQKIIYDSLGIYVQKIVPVEFFKEIDYYPERYLFTDGGGQKRKL